EDVPIPRVHADAVQRIRLALESFTHVRSMLKRPIERITPRVIWAADAARKRPLGLGAHPGAPMATHVVESPDPARVIARYDDAFPRDVAKKVIARTSQPFLTPRMNPAAEIEPLHLAAKDFGAGVVLRGQRSRPLNFRLNHPKSRLRASLLRVIDFVPAPRW